LTDTHPPSSEVRVVLAIALGGAIGSMARYAIGVVIPTVPGTGFPTATLMINISGSLLIGLFMVATLERPSTSTATRLFLTTGVCGGFTTMSTLSVDVVQLLRAGKGASAVAYLTVTVIASLFATLAGMMAGRRIAKATHARD
jgi:fluoride exporter